MGNMHLTEAADAIRETSSSNGCFERVRWKKRYGVSRSTLRYWELQFTDGTLLRPTKEDINRVSLGWWDRLH
jgi:hypothetical protein